MENGIGEQEHIFGWDERHFLQCNLDALAAAFAPGEVKQRLEERLRAGYM